MATVPELTAIPEQRALSLRDVEEISEEDASESKGKVKKDKGIKPKGYKAKPSWSPFAEKPKEDTQR